MKRNLINMLLLLFTISLTAQDFAPVGSEWYFTKKHSGVNIEEYFKITSIKDTVFNDKDCKIIECNDHLSCGYSCSREIVYTEDSIVYFYEKNLNKFQILYNLKVRKGESWKVEYKVEEAEFYDSTLVTVDKIDFVTINNKELKRLYVTYSALKPENIGLKYTSTIIESIGDVTFLFNLINLGEVICDANYSTGLRCYEDSIIGYYSTGISLECDYISTHIFTFLTDKNVAIYPNPTSNLLHIDCSNKQPYSVIITDVFGKSIVTKHFISNNTINVNYLSSGLYFVSIKQNGKVIHNQKIIKN